MSLRPSLWAWDVEGESRVAWLNDNLIFRLADYMTGEPFYTFLGVNQVCATVAALINRSLAEGGDGCVHLVPEIALSDELGRDHEIEPSRDHFDYVIRLDRCASYSGGRLKSRRNLLNAFRRQYPSCAAELLDLSDERTAQQIDRLYGQWSASKVDVCGREWAAWRRFVDVSSSLAHLAIGLMLDGELIAFHVSALPPGGAANGMFEKADVQFAGVYQALMHEVAKALMEGGKSHLNYQQDLGLPSLRRSKSAYDPESFGRKFTVRRR